MICTKNYENIFKFVKVTQNTVDTFFQTRCRLKTALSNALPTLKRWQIALNWVDG